MVPGLGVVVCLECMGVGRPVVRQSVVIDEAAQIADLKWAEQPLFFRLVEQCQRLFRLIESYLLNMRGRVQAVRPVRCGIGKVCTAGAEQEGCRAGAYW